jgi:hypothetical protein
MQTLLYAFVGIGLASHFYRMNAMVNNRERYERFHRWELEFAKLQDAAGRRIVAEGKRAVGWLTRKVKERSRWKQSSLPSG